MVSDFMEVRWNLMIYVSINIDKPNHFILALSSEDEVLIEPFKFTHDGDSFQMLVSKLDSFDKDFIIIILESTAHYGENLVVDYYKVCATPS